jgi:transposase
MDGARTADPTGSLWRCPPKDGFPPGPTADNIFRKFHKDETWETIWGHPHMELREKRGREASPSAAVMDNQTAEGGGKRGCKNRGEADAVAYGAAKKVKCRKIHALVDTQGLPLRVIVHSAGHQDCDGTGLVLDKIRARFPGLEPVWADNGYNAHQVTAAVAANHPLRIEIVKRSADMKGLSGGRAAGWPSAPSRGSAETAAWPRITKTSP